jgi:aspartate carbamoyltransferase catalytic subunit
LVTVGDLSDAAIAALLRRASEHADGLLASDGKTLASGAAGEGGSRLGTKPLAGRSVVLLFFEDSTRTRASFDLAAARLGAHVVNLDVDRSSVSKGESLADTLLTLDAMRPDAVVMRHRWSGAARFASRHLRAAFVNAGAGTRSHPTQALLDALTIRRVAAPRLDMTLDSDTQPFAGLRVAIVGDIRRSRVARSNIALLTRLGAELTLIGPPAFLPQRFGLLGVRVAHSLEDGLRPAPQVVYALRVQREREPTPGAPSVEAYAERFCITEAALDRWCPEALVMHPGPVNRGVDVSVEVLTGPRSLVLDQVAHGVAMRMAILESLVG